MTKPTVEYSTVGFSVSKKSFRPAEPSFSNCETFEKLFD